MLDKVCLLRKILKILVKIKRLICWKRDKKLKKDSRRDLMSYKGIKMINIDTLPTRQEFKDEARQL